MFKLQKYLRSGKSVDDLEKEFGIYTYNHPDLPLVGFKYGLIDSKAKQFHPIVRESRGIVLERDSWDIVAFPFTRFFNLGEDSQTESEFNWDNFVCQEKLDGSIIIVYYYSGSWHVNTSGSFGKDICYESGVSWEDLFWITSGLDRNYLIKDYTYIFELCTRYNKIIRSYKDSVYLLGVRQIGSLLNKEFPFYSVENIAKRLRVPVPSRLECKSIDDILSYLKKKEQDDPTFEGFVLCDDSFRRIKVKSDSYKQLHQLKGNGQFIYRNIIPQLLKGNYSTLSKNFPEWLEELESCHNKIEQLKKETDNVWFTYQTIKDRKKFAKSVLKETTFPSILFYLYDGRFATVDDAFEQSEDLLIKYFESKGRK